jgi:hypothetical protein
MKKIISVLAVSAFLIPCVTAITLQYYYALNRPESAQIETGRTVPIMIREGHVSQTVYITSAEASRLNAMFALTIVGAGIFASYVIVRLVKGKRDSANL